MSNSAVPAIVLSSLNASDPASMVVQSMQRLEALLAAGGPVALILLLLSTVAIAVVLLKWWQFRHLRITSPEPVNGALDCWQRRDSDAAIERLADARQPTARLVHLALINLRRPGINQADLREELTRVASAALENLRSHLRTLEVIATLSPLLGLLGTVLGMIEAFQQLENAGSQLDPGLLSGGIWQALLTTALGLGVAIPVVLAHSWLERQVERCRHAMEDAVTRVFTRDLQWDTLPDRPAPHETKVTHAT
ncbi:MAG: MotA/TolQ/ExbB proton channel family protein [Chromatiaceae bacterium]|nr:MotA/TolQ/ExbB proton channel family protein [Chromatiaceae bacterium]